MPIKKNKGKLILFHICIILSIFIVLFGYSISADDNSDDFGYEAIKLDDGRYVRIDVPKKVDNDIKIEYPDLNLKVIPPEGSRILKVSNETIDLIFRNNINVIRYDKTISKFCPINFKKSISGTNNFELNIYNNNYLNINTNENYINYIIDWGNGESIKGTGNIPTKLSYNYTKQGNYPLRITVMDSNGVKYVYQKNQTYSLSLEQYIKLWSIENKETVAVGSAGTIGIMSLLGVALTETGKYKILALLLLALPMFTKIQKEDVLDHFVRGQIYGYIKAYPGAHYNQIMRELDIKNGTLSYHLYILEKTGTIKSRKEGYRYRAFYPSEIKFPEEERYRLTELQLNIIKFIQENKGINQKIIAKKLNENHQTISYNIKVLQQAGIININRKGRKTLCYVNQNLSDKLPI
jgi:predicted transcriptional regulator